MPHDFFYLGTNFRGFGHVMHMGGAFTKNTPRHPPCAGNQGGQYFVIKSDVDMCTTEQSGDILCFSFTLAWRRFS